VRRFDAQGRETFVSYPVHALHSVDDVTLGSRTTYDALGRARAWSRTASSASSPRAIRI
jgi:hypothetical protein